MSRRRERSSSSCCRARPSQCEGFGGFFIIFLSEVAEQQADDNQKCAVMEGAGTDRSAAQQQGDGKVRTAQVRLGMPDKSDFRPYVRTFVR